MRRVEGIDMQLTNTARLKSQLLQATANLGDGGMDMLLGFAKQLLDIPILGTILAVLMGYMSPE